jgi:hypothetical protein
MLHLRGPTILNIGLAAVRIHADLSRLKAMLLIEMSRLAIPLERIKRNTGRRQCFRFVEQKSTYALVLEIRCDEDLIQVAIELSQDEKTGNLTGAFRYPYTGVILA